MDDWIIIVLVVILFLLIGMTFATTNSGYYRHEASVYAPVYIGDIKFSAMNKDNQGWMICDGRSVNRHQYHNLFSVIGTSFGSASASTFNLPDARGRVPGTIGPGVGLTSRALGNSIGQETFTLTLNELPSHNHAGTTSAAGAHNHSITDPGHAHSQYTYNDDYNNSTTPGQSPPAWSTDAFPTFQNTKTWNNINTGSTGISLAGATNHTHSFTTSNTGSGNPFSIIQPTLFVGNMFIYAGPLPDQWSPNSSSPNASPSPNTAQHNSPSPNTAQHN